jgi:hypothetical protein
MTETKTSTSVEFETQELQFMKSVLLFSLTELKAKKNEAHSGVDKVLYDTWIADTCLAIEKFGKALASTQPLPPFYEASVEG